MDEVFTMVQYPNEASMVEDRGLPVRVEHLVFTGALRESGNLLDDYPFPMASMPAARTKVPYQLERAHEKVQLKVEMNAKKAILDPYLRSPGDPDMGPMSNA